MFRVQAGTLDHFCDLVNLDPIIIAVRPKKACSFWTRQKKRGKFILGNTCSSLSWNTRSFVRFDVLRMARIKMVVFWVVALCSLVEVY
jgi:hypothetical protein